MRAAACMVCCVSFRLMEGIYSPKTVKGVFGGNTGMTATFYKTVMHKLKQLQDYDWNV
jgi:hypothetical protein